MSKISFNPVGSARALLRFVISPTLLFVFLVLWVLSMWCMVRADEGVLTSNPLPQITFENATPEMISESEKITASVLRRFEQICHCRVGKLPIRVCFTEPTRLRTINLFATCRARGVTFQEAGSSTIQISTSHRGSWGRIYAHELTHVLIREAYGKVLNHTLDEGMAEFIAGEIFPSEVNQELRRGSSGLGPISAALRPYVEGHRFICQHVSDNHFPAFFESELENPSSSYHDLNMAWSTTTNFLIAQQSTN